MMNTKKTSPIILFCFILLATSFANLANAAPIDKKLEQCKQAFKLSISKDTSQSNAVAANLKHLKLMRELLHDLNKSNADKTVSNDELKKNVMVMSHLLEMLVVENLNNKEQTWNMNY